MTTAQTIIASSLLAAPTYGQFNFDPPINYAASGIASPDRALAVADLNEDGFPDVIVLRRSSGGSSIQVFLNNGDGTLESASIYAGPGRAANNMALADLDGDGDLDVAVSNFGIHNEGGNIIALYENAGNGAFTAYASLACGEPTGVALGDFDRDGDADLTGIDWNFDVCVYENLGDGTMSPLADFNSNVRSRSITTGDLDGDGDLDLALANASGPLLTIGFNNGGTFGAWVDLSEGASGTSVLTADFNGDGYLDLAMGNSGWPTFPATERFVALMMNNGDGTFAPEVHYDPGPPIAEWDPGGQPLSLAASDLDGDGDLDIAVANCNNCLSGGVNLGSSNVAILPNNGDGTFAKALHFIVGPPAFTWGGPRSIGIADMDGDGYSDIVTYNATRAGAGSPEDYTVSLLFNTTAAPGTPGDLDGDGVVGTNDLLILLGNWGPCPPQGDCPADLDGNSSVGVADLLVLLANWG